MGALLLPKQEIYTDLFPKQDEAWTLLEEDPEIKEVFFGGAAGPGKSWLGCLWKIYRRVNYPGTRGLIGRDQYSDLHDTTLKTFLKLWTEFGQYNPLGVAGSYNGGTKTFRFSNGSEEMFRHLTYDSGDPDFHRLGSLELTDVFVDELPEITEKAWNILITRIRYKLDALPVKKPKALGCGNPANNWAKLRYVLDEENHPVVLKSHQAFVPATLDDNLDEAFRLVYDDNLKDLPNYDQQRLRFGDWTAVDNAGNKFYWAFERSEHVGKVEYNEGLPMHLSFDQNVTPYATLTCWQVAPWTTPKGKTGWELRQVDEFCLPHPASNTEALCRAWKEKYGDRCREVFIYGDASGHNRSTRTTEETRGADTDYKIVKRELKGWIPHGGDRTERSNPAVLMRRDFINKIFKDNFAEIRIVISDRCLKSVLDLLMLNQDANGKKLKVKEKDPHTRERIEIYGHTSDTMDYVVCRMFVNAYRDFQGRKKK
jgi:phage terminase large subunit